MTYPVISFKPSYNSVIRGCPGISETLPRIECELKIRSSDGGPFKVDKFEVCLKTIENLNSSLTSFGSKSKHEKTEYHYRKNIAISDKLLLGIDIPLTVALPDDIKATNNNQNFGKTYTLFECNLHYTTPKNISGSSSPVSMDKEDNNYKIQSFMQPINVERYTYLATKRLYPSIKKETYSLDKKFIVSYKIHNPCITTDDLLRLNVEIKPNLSNAVMSNQRTGLFSKKTKLKSISYEIKEVLQVYDSNAGESREHTLHSITHAMNHILDNSGVKLKSDLRVSTKNEYFKKFEQLMQEPAFLYKLPEKEEMFYNGKNRLTNYDEENQIKTKIATDKNIMLIPFQYHASITTFGKLYSIEYLLYIKIKISSSKDIELRQRIDISPWPLSQVKYIEQIIEEEKEIARSAKQFYENFGGIRRNKNTGILEYPSLPPAIYAYDNETMAQLDILFDNKHHMVQRIPVIE